MSCDQNLVCAYCGGPAEGDEEHDNEDVCNDCYGSIQYDLYLEQQYEQSYDWQYQKVEDEHGNVYQPWSK